MMAFRYIGEILWFITCVWNWNDNVLPHNVNHSIISIISICNNVITLILSLHIHDRLKYSKLYLPKWFNPCYEMLWFLYSTKIYNSVKHFFSLFQMENLHSCWNWKWLALATSIEPGQLAHLCSLTQLYTFGMPTFFKFSSW